MEKSIVELLVGSLDDKRAYRELMKRVNALPKEYCYAYKKIQQYMYNFDTVDYASNMFNDLLELFEESVADGKPISQIIGNDVASFCDDLIKANETKVKSSRVKLNQEISDYFHKEAK